MTARPCEAAKPHHTLPITPEHCSLANNACMGACCVRQQHGRWCMEESNGRVRAAPVPQQPAHHEAIKGIHLPHQGALGQAPDARVAAPLPSAGRGGRRAEDGAGAAPGGSRRGLAAGVPTAHDDHVASGSLGCAAECTSPHIACAGGLHDYSRVWCSMPARPKPGLGPARLPNVNRHQVTLC